MEVSVLASGSSGNCFYVQDKNTAILIDAGISCKQILSKLNQINKTPKNIKAIFLTHEHIDHIRGADVLARHLEIPIFATPKTLASRFISSNPHLLTPIKNKTQITLTPLTIKPFSKNHQAADPISYTITNKKSNIAIITDIGFACLNTIEHISQANAICIEANHDSTLLQNGPYPPYLKKWIASDTGHLSNRQAALAILEHASTKLSHIILSHLSENNNTPELALKTFCETLAHRKNFSPIIEISSRHNPTPVFKL